MLNAFKNIRNQSSEKVYKVKENAWCYTMDAGPTFRTNKELKTLNTKKIQINEIMK